MPPAPCTIAVPVGSLGAPTDWLEDLLVLVTYEVDLPL
jgi:hypothetical protein